MLPTCDHEDVAEDVPGDVRGMGEVGKRRREWQRV